MSLDEFLGTWGTRLEGEALEACLEVIRVALDEGYARGYRDGRVMERLVGGEEG